MALYRERPFGTIRDDYRLGMISYLLAEIHRDTKKKKTPYKIEEFLMPSAREVKEEKMSVSGMRNFLEMLTMATGGKDLRKK